MPTISKNKKSKNIDWYVSAVLAQSALSSIENTPPTLKLKIKGGVDFHLFCLLLWVMLD